MGKIVEHKKGRIAGFKPSDETLRKLAETMQRNRDAGRPDMRDGWKRSMRRKQPT